MSFRQLEAMRKIGMDEAEIADILETDKRIDQGEKLFELPDELKAGAKKARQADRKKTAPPKREKKADEVKQKIISVIAETLTCSLDAEELKMVNPEREFLFTIDGRKFKITLACPRS